MASTFKLSSLIGGAGARVSPSGELSTACVKVWFRDGTVALLHGHHASTSRADGHISVRAMLVRSATAFLFLLRILPLLRYLAKPLFFFHARGFFNASGIPCLEFIKDVGTYSRRGTVG